MRVYTEELQGMKENKVTDDNGKRKKEREKGCRVHVCG